MKLKFVRLAEKGMQVHAGRLRQDLAAEYGYTMTLLSNTRSVKIMHEDWTLPVYVPLERVASYTPLEGEVAK